DVAVAVEIARAVPDVPLVEGDPQGLRRALARAHVVADVDRIADAAVHREIQGQVFGAAAAGLIGGVAVVLVDGEAIDQLVALIQDLAIPLQVRRQIGVARAVVLRGAVPDLPRAVHLVAQAPVPYPIGIGVPVRAPQIAPAGASGDVAIL